MSWFLARWLDAPFRSLNAHLDAWRDRPRPCRGLKAAEINDLRETLEAEVIAMTKRGAKTSLHVARRGGRQPTALDIRAWRLYQMADRLLSTPRMHDYGVRNHRPYYRVWVIDKTREGALYRFDSLVFTHPEFPAAVLVVTCPSKKTKHVLCVPPSMRSVRQARAWTFGVNEDEFKVAAET
jgi:hypothetical protein